MKYMNEGLLKSFWSAFVIILYINSGELRNILKKSFTHKYAELKYLLVSSKEISL